MAPELFGGISHSGWCVGVWSRLRSLPSSSTAGASRSGYRMVNPVCRIRIVVVAPVFVIGVLSVAIAQRGCSVDMPCPARQADESPSRLERSLDVPE